MPSEIDTSKWSGEGTFTQLLIDRLRELDAIRFVRVEDAPATRSEADYNFISNELFVLFAMRDRVERVKRFGFLPSSRIVSEAVMHVSGLEVALAGIQEIGEPDYSDETMLRTCGPSESSAPQTEATNSSNSSVRGQTPSSLMLEVARADT
jgi:hypothetical protein